MPTYSAREKGPWWRSNEKVEEKIPMTAMTSEKEDAQQKAIDFINLRDEQGDYQWRELLDLK